MDMSWGKTDIQSPHRKVLPREEYIPESDLLFPKDKLAAENKAKYSSMDGSIYEVITMTNNDPTWVGWVKNAVLLMIHTIFWTLQT